MFRGGKKRGMIDPYPKLAIAVQGERGRPLADPGATTVLLRLSPPPLDLFRRRIRPSLPHHRGTEAEDRVPRQGRSLRGLRHQVRSTTTSTYRKPNETKMFHKIFYRRQNTIKVVKLLLQTGPIQDGSLHFAVAAHSANVILAFIICFPGPWAPPLQS